MRKFRLPLNCLHGRDGRDSFEDKVSVKLRYILGVFQDFTIIRYPKVCSTINSMGRASI